MDKKILISLTGTTCAGKSTLLKAIKEAYDDVFIIPQVTTHQPRSDEIEMLKSKSLDLLSYKNVLLTFTKDYNTEIEALSKQLKNQI